MSKELFKDRLENYISLTDDLILNNKSLSNNVNFFLGYVIQQDPEIKLLWKDKDVSTLDVTYKNILDYYEDVYPEDGYILFYDLLSDFIFNHHNLKLEISELIGYTPED